MREYRYLTHDDRLLIEKLYARGIAPSDIASVVGVSLATIYRELPRGYTDERFPGGRKVYSAAKAQQTVDQNIKRRGRSPADTMNKDFEIAVTLNTDEANEKLEQLTAKAQGLADLFTSIAEQADRAAKIMPPSAVEAVTAIRHGCPPTKNFMRSISEMLRISMPEFEKLEYSVSEGYNCTAGGGSWMVLHYKNGFSSHKIQISGCTRICILSQAVTNADMLRNDIGYKRCEEMCHQ